MKKIWIVMSGNINEIPSRYEGSFESLSSAQNAAKNSTCDGKAYYVFESVGFYVKEINWVPLEHKVQTR